MATPLIVAVAMLELRRRKADRVRVSVSGKFVDHGAAGVAQSQELGDFVEGFAGGIVAGVADVLIGPAALPLLCQIKMGVATRDHQCQHGETQLVVSFLSLFQQDSMNMPFQVIYCNQRLVEGKRQRLGVADTNQQSSGESRTLSDGEGINRVKGLAGIGEGFADHRHNGPQVLARSQFRHHSAIRLDASRSARTPR